MAKSWKTAPEYPINLVGTYEQHVLISHAMEAYEIFAPHVEVLVITSANDQHENRPMSFHHLDKALDFRSRNIERWQALAIVAYLNFFAPLEDWLFEGDHIHGEYDPK